MDKEFFTKEIGIFKPRGEDREEEKRSRTLEKKEQELEEIDGKKALDNVKVMLAVLETGMMSEEETLSKIAKTFEGKKVVFDEKSYEEFEKLKHKDLLMKIKAFRDAVEWFNSPERKLKEVLEEYENIKGLVNKVIVLEEDLERIKQKLSEVLADMESLKVKVENMDGSLNDSISKITARIEDMDKIRKEIGVLVKEYIELYKPDIKIDERWVDERVIMVLRELEEQMGTSESKIREEIESIVREEVEKAVSYLQSRKGKVKMEEWEVEEGVAEGVKVLGNLNNTSGEVKEKEKKKSLIAGVPDVVVYVLLALGFIFFIMQMLK